MVEPERPKATLLLLAEGAESKALVQRRRRRRRGFMFAIKNALVRVALGFDSGISVFLLNCRSHGFTLLKIKFAQPPNVSVAMREQEVRRMSCAGAAQFVEWKLKFVLTI